MDGYDNGGWLPPGLTEVRNDTGEPEYLVPPGHPWWTDEHDSGEDTSG